MLPSGDDDIDATLYRRRQQHARQRPGGRQAHCSLAIFFSKFCVRHFFIVFVEFFIQKAGSTEASIYKYVARLVDVYEVNSKPKL